MSTLPTWPITCAVWSDSKRLPAAAWTSAEVRQPTSVSTTVNLVLPSPCSEYLEISSWPRSCPRRCPDRGDHWIAGTMGAVTRLRSRSPIPSLGPRSLQVLRRLSDRRHGSSFAGAFLAVSVRDAQVKLPCARNQQSFRADAHRGWHGIPGCESLAAPADNFALRPTEGDRHARAVR